MVIKHVVRPAKEFKTIPRVSDIQWQSLTRPKDSDEVRRVAEALAPLGFRRNETFVYDKAGSRFLLQFARPDIKVNVEINGISHSRRMRAARDVARDRTMAAKGWNVVRVQVLPGGWSIGTSTIRSMAADQVSSTVSAALMKRPA